MARCSGNGIFTFVPHFPTIFMFSCTLIAHERVYVNILGWRTEFDEYTIYLSAQVKRFVAYCCIYYERFCTVCFFLRKSIV